jgi:molybdopterin adenylyltransferase
VRRAFRIAILTLSDRAAAGQYEDRSGPRIRELLETWLKGKPWHGRIDAKILPDDAEQLRAELAAARAAGIDVLFTTGGTGLGPRDTTPETVAAECDKLIPGIMENIRMKFGVAKPNALLSRSIAGVAGKMQVYTLPGSVRAVEEYVGEILKTMEHAVLMLHGIDVH